jgi:thiamine pyrophosphate-dependent acetolactate synthase large subunit-like protein
MSPVPASAITIAGGEITIDAELFPPKLGLSAAALKAEMLKGNVSSVAETGINEEGALKEAFARKKDLVFLDFITDQTENVFPMAPGGKGLSEMILG